VTLTVGSGTAVKSAFVTVSVPESGSCQFVVAVKM
jgi:hypothetical protein